MTQWTRTIGRMVTNATTLPVWVQNMKQTDRVYEVGALPSVADSLIVWPSAGAENALYAGTDFNYSKMHFGYGGAAFIPDLGSYGAMAFGYTGESTFAEQITKWTISDDAPTWNFLQQPNYATSLAQAVSMDADWYYSVADYNAIVAAHPTTRVINRTGFSGGVAETSFASAWDDVFPVGYANWVIRRKAQTSYLGNSRPWFHRYQNFVYIPASMTGNGSGAIVVNSQGWQGPFSQSPKPGGNSGSLNDDRWWAETWATNQRKRWMYAMNVSTGTWTRLTNPVPQAASVVQNDILLPSACVDSANKKVFYWLVASGSNALMAADFTSGVSGMTWSGPSAISNDGGQAQSLYSNCVLAIPTSGAIAGKRLWFWRDSSGSALLMIDINPSNIAASTIYKLTISGLPANTSDFWSFAYDQARNLVFITVKSTSGVSNYRFSIPTNYTSAAAYSVTSTALTLTGVTLESGVEGYYRYGADRGMLLPSLGVILLTQRNNKMLGFKPS